VNCVGAKRQTTRQSWRAAHVDSVAHLVVALLAAGVPRLVHVSVAGLAEGQADPYSVSKLAGEATAEAGAAAGLEVVVVRPGVVWGDGDDFSRNLAASVKVPPPSPSPSTAPAPASAALSSPAVPRARSALASPVRILPAPVAARAGIPAAVAGAAARGGAHWRRRGRRRRRRRSPGREGERPDRGGGGPGGPRYAPLPPAHPGFSIPPRGGLRAGGREGRAEGAAAADDERARALDRGPAGPGRAHGPRRMGGAAACPPTLPQRARPAAEGRRGGSWSG
jgi:hypothetical protein